MLSGLLLALSNAFALEGGDYIYTRDGRFKIALESENLVTNGYFTLTDYTSSDFGWTDADGGNLGVYMAIEPNAGPNGENVMYSVSTESSMKQAIPYSTGKTYVITMKVKGPANTPTVYAKSTSNNYIDVYAVKDADGDLDSDNNYQRIAYYDAIETDWTDITFSFADETGYDGYLVILIQRLTAETLIGNIEIREAEAVGDDREVGELLENAIMLIESGEFSSDETGFADAVYEVEEQLETDPSVYDNFDDIESLQYELSNLQDTWMDESSCSMAYYFEDFLPSEWGKYNPGTGFTSIGNWTFTGSRWGHASGSDYAQYAYPSNVTLGRGIAELTQTGLPAGRYMFSVEAYSIKYASGVWATTGESSYYIPNYSYYVTNGAYLYIGEDQAEIDTLDNYEAHRYYVFGEIQEGDTLKAGIYFPGFTSGGGVFYFGNPEIRLMGKSAEVAEQEQFLEEFVAQQANLIDMITQAQSYLDMGYPWQRDELQTTTDSCQIVYNESLSLVCDGTFADGVEYEDIDSDWPELLEQAVENLESEISSFLSTNETYITLVEYVAEAQNILSDESYSEATEESRTALSQEIETAQQLIDSATSEDNSEEFQTEYDILVALVASFQISCASYTNPVEIEYSNNDFSELSATGWTATGQSDNGGWKYAAASDFTGGYKIYVSRGYANFSKNKVCRTLTITEPGVYEFKAQAYAVNTYQTYYDALWNGLSGEDSLRSANIKMYFGLVDEAEEVDVLTRQENFGTDYWYYDEVRDYAILYTKTSDSSVEESVEIGFDAMSNGKDDDGNSLGGGANLYGFGSTHIYYYGSEENYSSAISSIYSDNKNKDGKIYSLTGVCLGTSASKLNKGIYIRDGKKFMIR